MAIFSRRTLQRLLNENATFLKKRQTQKHVEELNKGKLETEWEVVLLNVFNKLGRVEHEPRFNKSQKKIDILFSSASDHRVEFLADITTVSDKGIDELNPVRQFADRLDDIIIENDLKGAWTYEIGANVDEFHSKNETPRLKLPALSRFDSEIFNREFDNFIKEVKQSRENRKIHEINEKGVELKIEYAPSHQWTTTGILGINYKLLTHRRISDSLYEKYDQIKQTGYNGKCGIIICDGGCEKLVEKHTSQYGRKTDDVINDFLHEKKDIDFVLVVWVDWQIGLEKKNKVSARVYGPDIFDPDLKIFFRLMFSNLSKLFPYPVYDALVATNYLKFTNNSRLNEGSSFGGGMEWSPNEIKISSRSVLDLMTGRLPQDIFLESHKSVFESFQKDKKLIISVQIESENEEDDDWMVFTFGDPDPAVSPFEMPNVYN